MRDPQGTTAASQGLALNKRSFKAAAAMRSRLKSGEVTERKQVGDAESMINEEPNVMQPGGGSEWLE